jgi:predicted secreted protein
MIILVGAFLMSVDCPPEDSSEGTAAAACLDQVTATKADNGREIRIGVGGLLTIKLEAKMGTGASWKVVNNDPQKLEQVGEKPTQESIEQEAVGTERNKAGAAEYLVFRFKALTRGVNLLELQYARWWAAKPTIEEIYRLTIHIY